MSESVWKRIEESRARHNVLEHPFYVRWSAGELSADELARYSGQYRHATEALAKLCGRHGRARARRAPRRDRAPRRRGAGPHRPLGRLRAGGRRRDRRRADRRDGRVRSRLDGARGLPVRARPPLRDRERPAGDLADQARGPGRVLRDRRRRRQRVLPGSREHGRGARRRVPPADRARRWAPRTRTPSSRPPSPPSRPTCGCSTASADACGSATGRSGSSSASCSGSRS